MHQVLMHLVVKLTPSSVKSAVIELVFGITPDVIDVSALPVCLRSSTKPLVALYLV